MRTHLRTGLVTLLALGLFAWFLRSANLSNVWAELRRARGDLLGLSLLLVATTYWARAVRWQYLLAPIGPTRLRTALRTTVIGFAASFLLPARAGDVLRPYLLAKKEGLNPSSTFATIVIERVLDMVAVLLWLSVYAFGAPAGSADPAAMRAVRVSAVLAAAAAVVLMTVLFVLATRPERVGALVLSLGRVLPARLVRVIAAFATSFSEGLAVAKTPKPLAKALALSIPIWFVIAMQGWAVTRAFGIEMPVVGAFLVQALLVIGIAVPTPGGVGGFHEAYRVGVTTFFGATNDAAIGAAIILHAVSFVPVTILGVWFMAADGMNLFGLQSVARDAQKDGGRS